MSNGTRPNRSEIIRHIRSIIREQIDRETWIFNATTLAESTFNHFGITPTDDDPVWDLAVLEANRYNELLASGAVPRP